MRRKKQNEDPVLPAGGEKKVTEKNIKGFLSVGVCPSERSIKKELEIKKKPRKDAVE